jgi:hypothetical protein
MLKVKNNLFLFCLLISLFATAQQPTIKILESGKRISIRGLSVVSDKIIWASGSGGNVARSTDGGNTFTWMKVPGYEKNDFRDIEAFDENTAVIMGITTPAVILKTKDGGKNWKKVFEDTTKGAFFDAMAFSVNNHGTLVGDPLNNKVFLAYTSDGGDNWEVPVYQKSYPGTTAKEGEAFFASSGTNIAMLGISNHSIMVSGGKASRLFTGVSEDSLPIMQGKESTGANSVAVYNGKKIVIVGGDFTKDTVSNNNFVLTDLDLWNPMKYSIPKTPPHGYRSCVIFLSEKKLLTCGTSGIDISKDGGMNWELISKESFHVCQKAKKGKAVFLAGSGGRIAKLVYP